MAVRLAPPDEASPDEESTFALLVLHLILNSRGGDTELEDLL